MSGKESLSSNIALIVNNARVGARLAVALTPSPQDPPKILVVGGAAVDISYRANADIIPRSKKVEKIGLVSRVIQRQ